MISIYFRHKTRVPHNVILAWHDAPEAPAVGDMILPYPEVQPDEWVVVSRSWFNGGTSVDVLVRDAEAVPDAD